MNIREKYYFITGDKEGAYSPSEADQEGFKYSEDTLQRAIDIYENTTTGTDDKPFFRDQLKGFGPRAGATLGQMYPMSREAGMNEMDIQIEKAKGAFGEEFKPMDLLKALASGSTEAFQLPSRRVGAMQGLLNFFMDR
jgi:hypothetical protein